MSIKIKVYNQEGLETGEKVLSEKIFAVPANEELIRQVVVSLMANKRKVIAHTKTRSNVRGGGRKPWKQKGTGRARAGTIRSPLWIGGGVVFGPLKERNFKMKINKKMNQKAIFMAISDRVKNDSLVLLDSVSIDEYKTKKFEEIINKITDNRKQITENAGEVKKKKRSVLMILEKSDGKTIRSGKNLSGVEIINLDNINLLDLLKYRELVLTVGAAEKLEERYKKIKN
ncbi:MAG: 50S ribosomal protein L4 [Patescibacteria group bacterium]|jgi:large subunit ribosomal protein L4